MTHEFKQQTVSFSQDSIGHLKVSTLLNLIQKHPYYKQILEGLNFESFKNDVISIQNIDTAYKNVKNENERFDKVNAIAETKNIMTQLKTVDGKTTLFFDFEECRIEDELKENLSAEAIYDSKNTFFDEIRMAKYANHLLDSGFPELVKQNVEYFKGLASADKKYNKLKSYRLLFADNRYYLRGVTSEKYNEYGIDFTFFISMILLHLKMKQEKGNNYSIVSMSLSESKLDMIVKDSRVFKVENFGNVTLGIKISTNELGTGSLNVVSTIRVEGRNDSTLLYLFPKQKSDLQTKHVINHITNLTKVFSKLSEFEKLFTISDEFVKDIKDLKSIKTPDELRNKIQMKIIHPASVFKNMNDLKDIFKNKINNEINNFSTLLQMCKKAEELEMDYDIKDKLRYIISDIILYGNTN